MQRKKKRLAKALALTLATTLLPWSSNVAFAEMGTMEQGIVQSGIRDNTLPEPAYFWDFETGNVSGNAVGSMGTVTEGDGALKGAAALKGSAKIEKGDITIGETAYNKESNSVLTLAGGNKGTSYVELPEKLYSGVNANTGLTWSFWMKPDAKVESYSRLFSSSNSSNQREFAYAPFGNDKVWNLIFDDGTDRYKGKYEHDPEKNVWSYITVTISGDEVVFYTNGRKCASGETVDGNSQGELKSRLTKRLDELAGFKNHALGKTTSTWSDKDCAVQLDDVAVYHSALTEEQVAALAKSYGLDALQDHCDDYNYYEAEDTTCATVKGTVKASNNNYASGKKHVGDLGNGANNTLTYTVNVGNAGSYKLKLYFASGEKRNLYMKANGGAEIELKDLMVAEKEWNAVASKTVDIELQAGSNSIVLYNNNAYGPNVDRIAIAKEVTKTDISSAKIAFENNQSEYPYTGQEVKPAITVAYGDKTLTQDTDYTVSYENNTQAGEAKVIVTGIGGYSGTAEAAFTISQPNENATELTDADVALIDATAQYVYTGAAIKPEIKVTVSNSILTQGTDYSVSYADNVNAGEATAIVMGMGNYKGTVKKTFTIKGKSLSEEAVTLKNDRYLYTGKEIKPEITVKDGDKALREGTDYTVTYAGNKEIGTAKITVTGKGNYAISVEKEFTIAENNLPKPSYFWDFNSVSGTTAGSSGTASNGNAVLKGTARAEQGTISIGDKVYGETEGNAVLTLSGGNKGSSYADLPTDLYSGVTSGTGLTWSFWMKQNADIGSYTRVFSSSNGGSDGSHGREFAYAPFGNDKQWNLIFDDGSKYRLIYDKEPEKSVWNYITITVSKDEAVLYINGDKCGSTIKEGSAAVLKTRLDELKSFTSHALGKTASTWGDKDCKVQLDDVALYNKALTEEEAADLARTYGLEPAGPRKLLDAGEGSYGTKKLTQVENAAVTQGKNTLKIWKDDDNSYYYSVTRDGKVVIECSAIGLVTTQADLAKGMALDASSIKKTSGKEEYDLLQGSTSHVSKDYQEVSFDLTKGTSKVTMVFRVFDDGAAYRYVVDGDTTKTGEKTTITEEKSEFMLPDKGTIWTVTPSATYEGAEYTKRNMADLYDANTKYSTPILASLKEDSGNAWVLLTEASVYNEEEPWCASIFETKPGSKAIQTIFGIFHKPKPDGSYAWGTGPDYIKEVVMTDVFHSPWRAAIIADDLESVTNSSLVTDLNPDPAEGSDFSWVEPGAAVWSWWSTSYDAIQPSTMYDYIDFASEAGMKYCLVDFGWELWDDFRNKVKNLADYAEEKNVGLLLWYGVNKFDGKHIFNLNSKQEIEKEFAWCEEVGVKGVKVDYFNSDRQFVNGMQNMYWIADIAAKHKLVVNYHGCTNPNGENRTYPNILSNEAVYGMENCKWGKGSSIATLLTLPYTRNVLGSMEFTPTATRVSTGSPATAGFMLAESVVYESAMQTFAQSAYNYPGYNGLSLIADVPTTWDDSLLLEGYPGESVIRARRKGENWYLGAMTLEAKTYSVPLSFLGGGTYHAYIYADNEKGDDIVITTKEVTSADTLSLPLLANGGCSVKFTKTDPIKKTVYDDFNYYEAEDASHASLNGTAKAKVNNYASRLKCVEGVGNGAGNNVTYTNIPAAEDGYYTLKVHYVSGSPRNLYIRVNENEPVTLAGLVANANDNSAVASKAVTVQLKKGANTICLYNDLSDAPNIDRIAVSKSKLEWTKDAAEDDIKKITVPKTVVEEDFILPAFGIENGSVITWKSDYEDIIRIDGSGNAFVTRPAIGEEDVTVTLTPTVTYTGGTVSGADISGADGKPCTFTITVKAEVDLATVPLLADFSFDDQEDGLSSTNAKATVNGTDISVRDDAKFGKSLYLGDKTYLDVKKTDGTALLKGKDEITISYYSKSEFEKTTQGSWTFFAAENDNKISGNADRHYLALLDAKNAVKSERFIGNSGYSISTDGLTNAWRKVDLVATPEKTVLYIDGVKKAESKENTQALSEILGESGGVLYIGKATWGSGEYYKGLLDEYKIYDKALTAAEVKRAYEADEKRDPNAPKKQQGSLTITCEGFTYDGTTKPQPKVANTTNTGAEVTYAYYGDAACKKEIAAPVNAGTYYVKGTAKETDKYMQAVSGAVEFKIAPKKVEKATVTGIVDLTYTGKALIQPNLKVTGYKEGVDYTVSYANNVNVGKATVTITFRGNYMGVVTAEFQITQTRQNPQKPVPAKNKTYKSGKYEYKVTKSAAKGGTVELKAPLKKTMKTVSVPSTVKINGYTFKVTSIGKNAFKSNKKLTKATIGANVAKIGANAFSGCKKLKTITVKTKKLKAKSVGKNAFKNIHKKAVIKVPKAKKKAYMKVFKGKGQKKTVKIK